MNTSLQGKRSTSVREYKYSYFPIFQQFSEDWLQYVSLSHHPWKFASDDSSSKDCWKLFERIEETVPKKHEEDVYSLFWIWSIRARTPDMQNHPQILWNRCRWWYFKQWCNRSGDFQSLAWNCRRPQRNFVEMTNCVISWENWQLAAVQSDENEWVQICTVRLGSWQTKKNKGRNFDVVMWDRVDILNFSKLLFKNVVSLKKVSLDRETKERYFKNLLYFEHDKQMMKNWRLPMTPS